jgi:hypothetical protein
MAEQSLNWRKEGLKEWREIRDRAEKLAGQYLHLASCMNSETLITQRIDSGWKSIDPDDLEDRVIKDRDIFALHFESTDLPFVAGPFVEYLRYVLASVDAPASISGVEGSDTPRSYS